MLDRLVVCVRESSPLICTSPVYCFLFRYDPAYGARPLKRTIQREVETVLAKRIISGEVEPGDLLVADIINERLVIAAKAKGSTVDTAPTPDAQSLNS